MKQIARALGLALAGTLFLATTWVEAQGFQGDDPPTVQIAPFAGYHFGGSVRSETLDREYSFQSGLDYGGTLDIALSETWRVEFLYLRQETSLESSGVAGPSFDLTLERYMIGIQEEKGEGSVKVFGVLLAGATRLIPGLEDAGSETYFSAALSLGVKTFFSRNFGLRFEARGFYTRVSGGGGFYCTAGQCLFSFSGSGVWQGDVSGGLILAF